MHRNTSHVFAFACITLLAACSTDRTATPTPPPPSIAAAQTATETGGRREQEVTMTATVDSIDVDRREVTLRASDGSVETIRLSPEVRNLDQVKRGDEVVVTYYQSIAFDVVKPSEAELGAVAGEGLGRAEPGSKPGALGARMLTIVADVVEIDPVGRTAVLRGPEGRTMRVAVANPVAFEKVKAGDRVQITMTEAMAVAVQPAPAGR